MSNICHAIGAYHRNFVYVCGKRIYRDGYCRLCFDEKKYNDDRRESNPICSSQVVYSYDKKQIVVYPRLQVSSPIRL